MTFDEARELACNPDSLISDGTMYLHGKDWEELKQEAMAKSIINDDTFVHFHRGIFGGIRINNVWFREDILFREAKP